LRDAELAAVGAAGELVRTSSRLNDAVEARRVLQEEAASLAKKNARLKAEAEASKAAAAKASKEAVESSASLQKEVRWPTRTHTRAHTHTHTGSHMHTRPHTHSQRVKGRALRDAELAVVGAADELARTSSRLNDAVEARRVLQEEAALLAKENARLKAEAEASKAAAAKASKEAVESSASLQKEVRWPTHTHTHSYARAHIHIHWLTHALAHTQPHTLTHSQRVKGRALRDAELAAVGAAGELMRTSSRLDDAVEARRVQEEVTALLVKENARLKAEAEASKAAAAKASKEAVESSASLQKEVRWLTHTHALIRARTPPHTHWLTRAHAHTHTDEPCATPSLPRWGRWASWRGRPLGWMTRSRPGASRRRLQPYS
jgi:hypothetical protein